MGISFRTLKDGLLTGLLGDAEQAENGRPAFMLDMLSDWLPYRVFDTNNRLYFNSGSKGFILSVTPLIGADERTGEILGSFFSEGLPSGACLQVLHHASPRLSRIFRIFGQPSAGDTTFIWILFEGHNIWKNFGLYFTSL